MDYLAPVSGQKAAYNTTFYTNSFLPLHPRQYQARFLQKRHHINRPARPLGFTPCTGNQNVVFSTQCFRLSVTQFN